MSREILCSRRIRVKRGAGPQALVLRHPARHQPPCAAFVNVLTYYHANTLKHSPAMKTNRPVTIRQEQQHERALCAAILALQSLDECRSFFRDLCTPAELQAMADRWAVVELLERGLPYREIHKQTGVSVTTIGRVARFLTSGNGGYRAVTGRLIGARNP
jgi:TrpR-related protein YerC/YecD